jgi:hypothetical protein
MGRDLGRLRIDTVIVHEVPHRLASGTDGEPVLSEIQSPLTQGVRNFFRERIARSLGTSAYDVQLDPMTASPVPALISDAVGAKSSGFVSVSQEMARHLYLCQKGPNPGGLLTVCEVTVENLPGIVILKLEKEEGARVRMESLSGGHTFSVEHLQDLMLTERTKVYKVGLFVRDGDSIEGYVCDNQKGYGATIAHFFLDQFLGCRLLEAPEITTKRFFDTTENFINDEVSDPEMKARYQVALLAELNSTRGTVSPESFANDNLELEHRQPFMNWVGEAQLQSRGFDKDKKLISAHLKKIQILFESGVAVVTPPQRIGEQVKITDAANGQTKVEVTDQLTRVHGRQ